jgi:hypothetical protein
MEVLNFRIIVDVRVIIAFLNILLFLSLFFLFPKLYAIT